MVYYIDIEGTDGSGKKTQSELLFNKLQEKNVNTKLVSFPNYDSLSSGPVKLYLGGHFGLDVNSLDEYQASCIFAVDRLCTMVNVQNEMKDGVVVFDRYTPSNLIHQACKIKDKEKRAKFIEWIDNFEYNELKLPRPTITIFLDVPVEKSFEIAQNRKEQKSAEKLDIHEKDIEYLKSAYDNCCEIAEKFNWIKINCIDNFGELKTIEEIHEEIMRVVNDLLGEK